MTVTNKYHNLILNFEELNATSLNLEADFAALWMHVRIISLELMIHTKNSWKMIFVIMNLKYS